MKRLALALLCLTLEASAAHFSLSDGFPAASPARAHLAHEEGDGGGDAPPPAPSDAFSRFFVLDVENESPAWECDGAPMQGTGGETVAFERDSPAWCTKGDASMVLLGSNQPRRSQNGFQLESESRTNYIFWNNELEEAWGGGGEVTPNTHAGPWGATDMDTLTSVPAGNLRYQCPGFGEATAGPFTVSAWGRAVEGTHSATMSVYCVGGTSAVSCTCRRADSLPCTSFVNADAECTGTSGFTEEPVRMEVTAMCSAPGTQVCIEVWGGDRLTEGTHVWGKFQFEQGTEASSPIDVTDTPTARPPEVASVTPSESMNPEGCVSLYPRNFKLGPVLTAVDGSELLVWEGNTNAKFVSVDTGPVLSAAVGTIPLFTSTFIRVRWDSTSGEAEVRYSDLPGPLGSGFAGTSHIPGAIALGGSSFMGFLSELKLGDTNDGCGDPYNP